MKLLKENIEGLRKINKLPEELKDFLHNDDVQQALADKDIDKLYKLFSGSSSHNRMVYSNVVYKLTYLLYSIGVDPLLHLNHIPNNFLRHAGIKSIVVPGNIISVGKGAFQDCNNLITVVIEDGVKSINSYAFYSCAKLTNVTLPSSIESIGFFAFVQCKQLTNINYKGTKATWKSIALDYNWKFFDHTITIHCTNGDINL